MVAGVSHDVDVDVSEVIVDDEGEADQDDGVGLHRLSSPAGSDAVTELDFLHQSSPGRGQPLP